MPSQRSSSADCSADPSRSRAWASSSSACSSARPNGSRNCSASSPPDSMTPGQRRISARPSAPATGTTACASAAIAARRASAARFKRGSDALVSRVTVTRTSTLPRARREPRSSRAPASSARSSSGTRMANSRKRAFTDLSSTLTVAPGVAAPAAAKPVMLATAPIAFRGPDRMLGSCRLSSNATAIRPIGCGQSVVPTLPI